jgi:toxin ParE1/3/4
VTFRYRLARSCRRDLQEIADYWTTEASEEVALKILTGILETVITLSEHPEAGVAAGQFTSNVRKFPAGQYMLYYRPYRAGIEMLHVFHGKRDQKAAWQGGRFSQH